MARKFELEVGRTYTAVPIFIKNSERRALLTCTVEIRDLPASDFDFVGFVHCTDGPYNETKQDLLWKASDFKWVEPHNWQFIPIRGEN